MASLLRRGTKLRLEAKIKEFACTGCEICVDSCPTAVIEMKLEKAVIVYPEDCQACYLCVIDCPRDAVEIVPAAQIKSGRSL